MNTIIIVDLHNTLQDPFKGREKRGIFYLLLATFAILYNCFGLSSLQGNSDVAEIFTPNLIIFLLLFKIVIMIMSLFYFVKVIIRLRMDGISMRLRSKIKWRNSLYFVFFFYISLAECIDLIKIYDCKSYFPFSINL